MTAIAFPRVERPAVSIVMVTYGGWPWVSEALGAVVANTPPCFEMIVVDNASPDGTGERVSEGVRGATVVRNAHNVGFGAGCNQGALVAVGRYVLFLNSDAFVEPGWLEPLVGVLDSDRRVAAVAPCLLDPDGRLQEAGGLVGGDGFAGQYGLGDDPHRFAYRFPREVDFASAAALLVRRQDFLTAGGFDPAYVQGYFEDVDICLRLARRGLVTRYEPAARVTHLRGASTGGEGALARAVASHPIFVGRWADELARRPLMSGLATHPHRMVASRDFPALDRILVVAVGAPTGGPASPGGRLGRLLEALAAWCPEVRVTALVDDGSGADQAERWAPPLLDRGVEVAVGDDVDQWLRARRYHYSVVLSSGREAFERFDLPLRRSQPQSLRAHDVGRSEAEPRAALGSDAVLCASDADRAAVRALVPEVPVFAVPDDLGAGRLRAALADALSHLGVAPPAGFDTLLAGASR